MLLEGTLDSDDTDPSHAPANPRPWEKRYRGLAVLPGQPTPACRGLLVTLGDRRALMGDQTNRWTVSDLRRSLMVTLALALVTGMAPAASASHDTDCRTVQPSSVPIVNVPDVVGTATVCDKDGDGTFDTVQFDTRTVPVEGIVSVTHEDYRRATHSDSETNAKVQISPGVPTGPGIDQEVEIEDDRDDGSIDDVDTEGSYESSAGSTTYTLFLFDSDGDGVVDSYGLGACTPGVCSSPGLHLVPDVPERIDLPDITL